MKDKTKSANPFAGFMSQLAQGGASGLVSGGVSSLFSELFADSQQKRMRDNMRFQQQLNLDSLRKSPLATVQGLKNAGLNPALLNGQSYSGQVAMAQQSQPTGSLTPISLSDMFGAMNAKANARYANAMAEKQELENLNTIHKNQRFGDFARDMLGSLYESGAIKHSNPFYKVTEDPKTGELILTWDPSEAVTITSNDFNAGDYQALKEVYQYMKDTNYNDFNSTNLEKMNKIKTNVLDNIVKDSQIKDKEVLSALKDMPIKEYQNLVAKTKDFLASANLKQKQGKFVLTQNDLVVLQKKYMENTSYEEAIQRISNPKSVGDFFKGVFLFILNFVRSNVHVSK